jgi:primary-amine oxidase
MMGSDVYRMPVEHIRLTLKPNSFFSANPSLDVPGRKDEKSVPAFGTVRSHAQGKSCCATQLN